MNDCAERLFVNARTANAFLPKTVDRSILKEIHRLMSLGPTSANCSPARVTFVQTREAKERLLACMSKNNREKTRQAPVTAIIGMDLRFYDQLPRLFPHADARVWFTGNDELIAETALRNGSLQGAYLMIAARLLGLDCGPMSGFDGAAVDREFWADTAVKTNFICNLGYADSSATFARLPRLPFAEACQIV